MQRTLHRTRVAALALRRARTARLALGLAAAGALAAVFPVSAAEDSTLVVWVGRFAEGTAPWRDVAVSSRLAPTRYAPRLWDGVHAVEASAERSMSLFARPLDGVVDLQRTPVLCWRWRIDAPLAAADMRRKDGDDYAARVYLSLALPAAQLDAATSLKLRIGRALWGAHLPDAALNYVWDNRQPVGTQRPNAYTDRTRMLVLRSGAADAGRWTVERRDVAADAQAAFGAGARAVQLALASDTDDTGERAHAGFADFHFVARDAACRFD